MYIYIYIYIYIYTHLRSFGQRPLCSPAACACLECKLLMPAEAASFVGCSAAPRAPKDHNKGTKGSGMHRSHRPMRTGRADSCKQS